MRRRLSEATAVASPGRRLDQSRSSTLLRRKKSRKTRTTKQQQKQPMALSLSSSSPSMTNRPLCRYFLRNGNCRYGDSCAYSHCLPIGRENNTNEARKFCYHIDSCQIRHKKKNNCKKFSEDTVKTLPTTTATSAVCGICLEDPATRGNQKYGLLSCCSHMFCYECLMEWRKEGSGQVEDRRSCPTCRKHSDYVIPSRVYCTESKEKDQIVQNYKDRLSCIPCKKFSKHGSCPFGRDCFFAHRNRHGQDVKHLDESMEEKKQKRQRKQRNQRCADSSENTADSEMVHAVLTLLDSYYASSSSSNSSTATTTSTRRRMLLEEDDGKNDFVVLRGRNTKTRI